MRETELYGPVKAYLESQGYEVKSEVAGADVVAQRSDLDEPVIVEMKTGLSLTLFHQGIARQTVTDLVYLAVPRGQGRAFHNRLKDNVKLARRLGLGLLTVRVSDGLVEAHCDPGPYQPRKSKHRKAKLLREFARRKGDPNTGGAQGQVVTAYRQDCERLAHHLRLHGPTKGADVARATGVPQATRMMRDNHYGWFDKVAKGIYAASDTAPKTDAGHPLDHTTDPSE
ncbi:MAG: DUF2161 domain-containing phosphodiesterase [Pseudomonadota bacterium]